MKKSFFILILFGLLSFPVWAQTYTLDYNLKQGSEYLTQFLSEISIKQTVMGIEQNVTMHMENDIHQQVNILENSHFSIISEYRKMYMKISTSFFTLEVDTDKQQPDDLLSTILRRVLDKPLNVLFAGNGEVKQITGIEALTEGLLDDPEMNENQKEEIRQLLLSNLGEESLRQYYSQMFSIYPDKPVSLNEPWEIKYHISQANMMFEFSGTGKIVEATPRTFLIRVEGILQTAMIEQHEEENNDQQVILSGIQVAEISIDRKTGWPFKSTARQDISGHMVIRPPGEENELLEIPMELKMRLNINSGK